MVKINGERSGMSVVSVSNISDIMVVYDGMVSTGVVLGCRHVSIERYHALGGYRIGLYSCKNTRV